MEPSDTDPLCCRRSYFPLLPWNRKLLHSLLSLKAYFYGDGFRKKKLHLALRPSPSRRRNYADRMMGQADGNVRYIFHVLSDLKLARVIRPTLLQPYRLAVGFNFKWSISPPSFMFCCWAWWCQRCLPSIQKYSCRYPARRNFTLHP